MDYFSPLLLLYFMRWGSNNKISPGVAFLADRNFGTFSDPLPHFERKITFFLRAKGKALFRGIARFKGLKGLDHFSAKPSFTCSLTSLLLYNYSEDI